MSHESWEAKKRRPHRYDAALQGHKLTIAYRGTDFAGWQVQLGRRTVQQCVEEAFDIFAIQIRTKKLEAVYLVSPEIPTSFGFSL